MDVIKESKTLGFERNGHLGFLIFESLPLLSDDEKNRMAHHIAGMFPNNSLISNFRPFKQHLHTSFMRKLFGMTERNGMLLNITHPRRKDQFQTNCSRTTEWDNSFAFVDILEQEFIGQEKQIGLILVHEALGHRYGDLYSVSVGEDKEKYREMMSSHYRRSFHLAKDVKCVKQMYVLWYWEGCYHYKNGNIDLAKKYLVKFHKAFAKYQVHARVMPTEKIKISFKLLRKILSVREYTDYLAGYKSRSSGKFRSILQSIS